MSSRATVVYSITLAVVSLCVLMSNASTVFADDIITVGYTPALVQLPVWDLGRNADMVLDTSTADAGNQVVPFGTGIYVGGTGAGVAGSNGLIMKYDTATGKLPISGTKWINSAKRDVYRPFAIDGSGNMYTAAWNNVAKTGNYITKYTVGTYAQEWSRQQASSQCTNESPTIMGMVIDGSNIFYANTACSNYKIRLVRTTTSSVASGGDWFYQNDTSYATKFSQYGALAIGPHSGGRYLYALGTTDTSTINKLMIVRWLLSPTTGLPNTASPLVWPLDTVANVIPTGMVVDQTSGNVYVTGHYLSGTKRIFYTKAYDSSGNNIWSAPETTGDTTASSNNIEAYGIALAPDRASVYVTGKSYMVNGGPTHPSNHFFTVQYKTTSAPLSLTDRRIGSAAVSNFGLSEQSQGIAIGNDGNVYITGFVPYDTATTDRINLRQISINNGSDMTATFGVSTALVVNTKHQNSASTKPTIPSKPFYVQLCVTSIAYDATNCYAGESPSNVEFAVMSPQQAPLVYSVTSRDLAFTVPAGAMAALAKGDHNLHVCVDPYRVVTEDTETMADNCKTIKLTINAPPEVTFTANPLDVDKGGTTTLNWNVTNATSCTGTGPGGFTMGGNYTSGNYTTSALDTDPADFQVDCWNTLHPQHTVVTQSVTVHNPQATIKASPARVRKSGSVTIEWSASDVTSCSITKQTQNGPASLTWGTTPSNHSSVLITGGSQADTITETSTYFMNCSGVVGGTGADAKVIVNLVPGYSGY